MEVKYYTPNTAVQMVHSPADEGKVLAIDEHGCVVLSDAVGGGTINIDLTGANEGEATPINADTLGGVRAEEYIKKSDAMAVTKNYSVVGGLNQPSNPMENMIWIQTETEEIGKVYFSGIAPVNAIDNDIWISTSNYSRTVAFDSIRIGDDTMQTIYPISAKQYVSGAWVDVTAKIYQGGEWTDWFTYIVKNGIALIDFSGNLRSNNDTTITKENGYLQVVINNSRTAGPTTSEKIDITNIKTIYLDVDVKAIAKDYVSVGIFSALNATTGENVANNVVAEKATTQTGRQVLKLPVDSYSGRYYIGMFSNDNSESQAYTREYHIYNLYYS